jgi:nucleotide-binding universal stress UspA family protein
MIGIKTILQPTDFSESAPYVLDLACAIARDQDARMVLLHVVPAEGPAANSLEFAEPNKAEHAAADLRAYRAEMEDRLRQYQQAASCRRADVLLKEGDVADAIVRAAEETCADLVVMGHRGGDGLGGLVFGGVPEAVMRRAPCPVLAAKLPAGRGPVSSKSILEKAGTCRAN